MIKMLNEDPETKADKHTAGHFVFVAVLLNEMLIFL